MGQAEDQINMLTHPETVPKSTGLGQVLPPQTPGASKQDQLNQAVNAGASMRVDPDEVDALAKFFEDEAGKIEDHGMDNAELITVEPPGGDPVSRGFAPIYTEVGSGNGQGYLENHLELAKVFRETAENLRSSSRQTRTDDQNAADSFRGADLEK